MYLMDMSKQGAVYAKFKHRLTELGVGVCCDMPGGIGVCAIFNRIVTPSKNGIESISITDLNGEPFYNKLVIGNGILKYTTTRIININNVLHLNKGVRKIRSCINHVECLIDSDIGIDVAIMQVT